MSGAATTGVDELLKRPLHVFDLPHQLLETLSVKSTSGARPPSAESESPETQSPSQESTATASPEIASATSCSLCSVTTPTVQEQRSHVRSDHHRYNVKVKTRGGRVLSEAEFAREIGDLDESISGSDSESSSDSDADSGSGQGTGNSTVLASLLRKKARIADARTIDIDAEAARLQPKVQPYVWFGSSLLPSATSLGVYRSLFKTEDQSSPERLLSSLQRRQHAAVPAKQANPSAVTPKNSQSHMLIAMLGGGHFASMIVSTTPVLHIGQGGVEDRQPYVLAHKSFHRYTTRRKQGGSQSAMDNSNRPASTAGSSLRRYNETALQADVRNVLSEWKEWIDSADLIFVRASGTNNKRVLFGPYDGQVLRSNDVRIRSIPFTTRRPTRSELLRATTELTRVKISRVDEAALAAAAEQQKREAAEKEAARLQKSLQQKPRETVTLSAEAEEQALHTTQIQALMRRSKIPALLSYLSNNAIAPNFMFSASSAALGKPAAQASHHPGHTPTPLHLAASMGSAPMVDALLLKAKLDPTILNVEGKTAFEVSADRAARDAFRIARHEMGEDAWDWSAARVPKPLSRAEVQARQTAVQEAADEAEKQRRKTELERLRKEEDLRKTSAREKAFGKGKTLHPPEKTWSQRREEETRGMTPEMRMKLERERRARAAEERIRKMQQGGP
ncbi:hypothetical protein KEM52_000486 [Ascosphaera acerosa]|nr:hypothetical protein KEM52_000486 [Ascosphaera acerosa]